MNRTWAIKTEGDGASDQGHEAKARVISAAATQEIDPLLETLADHARWLGRASTIRRGGWSKGEVQVPTRTTPRGRPHSGRPPAQMTRTAVSSALAALRELLPRPSGCAVNGGRRMLTQDGSPCARRSWWLAWDCSGELRLAEQAP